jgi:urease accessory protein
MIAPKEFAMRSMFAVALALLAATATPALAHHVMGGTTPATFVQGLLSGFGHPVIGLDHLATIVAVGFLASWHERGAALVIGFVAAMALGVALHVLGMTVPGAEWMIVLTVTVLGIFLVRREIQTPAFLVVLFVFAGFINGYALGESIFGAERTPYYAYLTGLAIIQSAIGLGAMLLARRLMTADVTALRLVGAGIVGIGIALSAAKLTGGA